MKTNIPMVYEIDIDATQKVFENVTEIFATAVSGGSVFKYFGLIDDLTAIISNAKEAAQEMKSINPLEREMLLKDNTAETLIKFNILNGKSIYGIENLKKAITATANLASIVITAAKDGIDMSDVQYLPGVLEQIFILYSIRLELEKEWADIQAQEAEDLLLLLNSYVYYVLGK